MMRMVEKSYTRQPTSQYIHLSQCASLYSATGLCPQLRTGVVLNSGQRFYHKWTVSQMTRSQLNLVTFLRTPDNGQNDSNRLIRLNERVGSGSGNRAHSAHSPQIIQINRSRASTLSRSMETFMFFDWLGYTHR
jgi:hypothetical protein